MNKSILVTGAAGFIGSHLCERLLAEGWKVTGIDNFDPFYDRLIKEKNLSQCIDYKNFDFFELDIRENDDLYIKLKDEYQVIAHIAAKAGVRPSIIDPFEYQSVNVYGSQNLLEFAKNKKIQQFIFTSSSSVYGVNPNVPWKESDHVLLPISPYASSKVSGELLGHVYSHIYNMRFIALRLFTVYGPRQRPDLAINKFTSQLLKGEPVTVYGDGTTKRDYTFIDDIINGILQAISYSKTNYEIINLGNSHSVILNDLLSSLENVIGKKVMVKNLLEQKGDVKVTYADITLANKLLDWRPNTNLKTGLTKYFEWVNEKESTVSF